MHRDRLQQFARVFASRGRNIKIATLIKEFCIAINSFPIYNE